MSYQAEVLADTPLVYYRFSNSGALTTDTSGNARTLTQTGTVTSTASLLNSDPANLAAQITNDPSSNYLELVDSSPVDFPGTASFTLECWFQADSADLSGFRRIISWSDDATAATNTYGFLYRDVAGTGLGAWRRVAGTDVISWWLPPTFLNAIFHLVMTYDGVNVHLFVNGTERDSDAAGSQGAYGGTFRIGQGQFGTSGLQGHVDEVAVYSGVLSDARILVHYQAGTASAASSGDDPPFGFSGRGAGW